MAALREFKCDRTPDANFNGTAVVDADWSADADNASDFGWVHGHQGFMRDPETGLTYNRNRYLHSSLGLFTIRDPGPVVPARVGSGGMASGGHLVQRDPYADGMNLYQYVQSTPVNRGDPEGLLSKKCPEGEIAVSNGEEATANGCGSGSTAAIVPEKTGKANFGPACNTHDKCYGDCGKTKAFCDDELVSDMKVECFWRYGWWSMDPMPRELQLKLLACFKIAEVYGLTVRQLGEDAHTDAQESYCKCVCPPRRKNNGFRSPK